LSDPALDAARSLIEERRQILIGEIGRSREQGLTTAFLGEPRTPRVWNPDLHRSQARLAKRDAPLADTRRSCRRHDHVSPDALHVTQPRAIGKTGAERKLMRNFLLKIRIPTTICVMKQWALGRGTEYLSELDRAILTRTAAFFFANAQRPQPFEKSRF
jgi:hypothetical protein